MTKFQVASFILTVVAVVLTVVGLFVVTESSSIHWATFQFDSGKQSFTFDFGLTRFRLKADLSQESAELSDTNCGDLLSRFEDATQGLINAHKICDTSKLMLGLGITSLALVALGLICGIVAVCVGHKWRWMLLTVTLHFIAAMFVALGAGLYRERMPSAIPDVAASGVSVHPSVGAGPMGLCFAAAILEAIAGIFYCPISTFQPRVAAAPNSPSSAGVTNHQGQIAFTNFSSDRDQFD